MSKFQELLTELEGEQAALAKALPADDGDGDEKIAAAAAEGGGQGEGESEGNNPNPDADGEGGEELTKSFKVKLADGTEADALDATELLKSLQAEVGSLKAQAAEVEPLAKALEQTLGLVKGQAALIKSLSAQVAKLGGEGRGRKAVVSIHDKPAGEGDGTLKKSEGGDADPSTFLAKANAAFDAGQLSGLELTSIDVSLRNRKPLDPALVRKVMQAKA